MALFTWTSSPQTSSEYPKAGLSRAGEQGCLDIALEAAGVVLSKTCLYFLSTGLLLRHLN